ncbi:MAG: A/G-specific adenine glycosylase [Schleiferiaceae bacterium]|nr:A/G-specific adenine glycosylase [Schleiferiaceae bacterium]
MTETTIQNFNAKVSLIEWFDIHRRLLPWRKNSNPYAIWLSEIILQQTRVDQGLPYWERFMEAFPNVKALANAPSDQVMALWAGLGYYSRARNLHRSAQQVVNLGDFPRSSSELLLLPGVGPYTAAAIASICFKERCPALDGNALRVYSRFFAIADRIDRSSTIKIIREKAIHLLDEERPGDSNQAIMDLGSRVCTPNQPKCPDCPLKTRCEAYRRGTMASFPVKPAKKAPKSEDWHFQIHQFGKEFALMKRPDSGIWGGLWCFPILEELTPSLAKELQCGHLLSHRKLRLFFHEKTVSHAKIDPALQWFTLKELKNLGLPVPIRWWFEEKNYF